MRLAERTGNYLRQNGSQWRVTGPQARRIKHKNRHWLRANGYGGMIR